MGKFLRSKPKKKRSRFGCQIITHHCESEIINHGCEGQIITQDRGSEIFNKDYEADDISQEFDCLNEKGILCSIISSLLLKEAIRTSLLSRRWKHIWTYLPVLKFDPENILDDETVELCKDHSPLTREEKCHLIMGKTDQFIRTVDSVLQQHQGRVRLDSFIVHFFLYKPHSHHLDAWVRFAVASKTRKLYLNLGQPLSSLNVELYDFPFHLLGSSSIEELHLICCAVKPPIQFDGLRHLKLLVMWYISATAEDIDRLFSNCSSTLQHLYVLGSKESVLSIPRSLSRLSHLAVRKCIFLRKIEINAVNVRYMHYEGVPVDFVLRQRSCLEAAEIYFIAEGNHSFTFYLAKLANDLPHLQYLTLNISGVSEVENLTKCSPFIHLKHLVWDCPEWSVGVKMSLLQLDTLLEAAPSLEKLELCFSTCESVDDPPPLKLKKLKKLLPKRPLSNLKNIEISGFYYERWQLKIVLYLLINAAELDSMTLVKGRESDKEISETDMTKLINQVPASVKLVIL